MKRFLVTLLMLLCFTCLNAQTKWYNPLSEKFPVIQNQSWQGETRFNPYNRLPDRAKGVVTDAVWGNSLHSAGLAVRFFTNSKNIVVKQMLTGGVAMNHMPATGVSGVDLYMIDNNGNWKWCACPGKYSFDKEAKYSYNNIENKSNGVSEFVVYLPLYNGITSMEIGVDESSSFYFETARKEKPIVVYGTSIAHGACASRPAMAWSNIVERRFDRPLINLGFSGAAYMEEGIVDLIAEIDAKVFVLDCMPNLCYIGLKKEDITGRIIRSVKQLRKKHPRTPILITDHAGYSHGDTDKKMFGEFKYSNEAQRDAIDKLKSDGIKDIYHLSFEEIGMPGDAMVDGVHPSDYGMTVYADAYEKKFREILKEPTGASVTQKPVTQYRDQSYNWMDRHAKIIDINRTSPRKTVVIGNSIMHYWGGEPTAKIQRDKDSWNEAFENTTVLNLSCGWDRIENILWRVCHDELDGFEAEKIIILAGTNNVSVSSQTDNDIVEGLRFLINAIKERQPSASIKVCGILPRRDALKRVLVLNKSIERMVQSEEVAYCDLSYLMLKSDGTLNSDLFMSDGLHINANGYKKISKKISE